MAAVSLLNLFSFSLRRKLFPSFRWWRKLWKCGSVGLREMKESRWGKMKNDGVQNKKLFNGVSSESHARTHTHTHTHSQFCSKGVRTWYVLSGLVCTFPGLAVSLLSCQPVLQVAVHQRSLIFVLRAADWMTEAWSCTEVSVSRWCVGLNSVGATRLAGNSKAGGDPVCVVLCWETFKLCWLQKRVKENRNGRKNWLLVRRTVGHVNVMLTLNIPSGVPPRTPECDFLWSCRNHNNWWTPDFLMCPTSA
jgi:hypothetical protein